MHTISCNCGNKTLRVPQFVFVKPQKEVRHAVSHARDGCKRSRRRFNTSVCSRKEGDSDSKEAERPELPDWKDQNFDKEYPDTGPMLRLINDAESDKITQKNNRKKRQKLSATQDWSHAASAVVSSIALPGCIAVSFGLLLHINPYGNFHWSATDAHVGLTCAIPILLYELGLMLPDFSSQAIRQSVDSSKLAAAQAKDALVPDSEPSLQDRQQPSSPQRSLLDFLTLRFEEKGEGPEEDIDSQPGLLPRYDYSDSGLQSRLQLDIAREAVKSWQIETVLVNQGLNNLWSVEALLLAGEHLTEQMLALAIVLSALSGWTTDRLLEAKWVELVPALANPSLTVADAGRWSALLAMLATVSVFSAIAAQGQLPLREQNTREAQAILSHDPLTKEAYDKDAAAMIAKYLVKDRKREKGELLLHVVRSLVGTTCCGSSFILTGNLLAPFLAAFSKELLFSVLKRAKFWQLHKDVIVHRA